jgi:hypothetical protein
MTDSSNALAGVPATPLLSPYVLRYGSEDPL